MAQDAEISEVFCKTALSVSRLPGLDYSLNPYKGCTHGCAYCYAPSMQREKRVWGSFVEAKTNIAQILERELHNRKNRHRGVVGIGTMTDPYQEAENKYRLTRACLKILQRHDYPICIQTKSAGVLRDADVLSTFSHCEVGITFTSIEDDLRRVYEGGSSFKERLDALKHLRACGVRTWAFIGPFLPGITDRMPDIKHLVSSLADVGVDYVMCDRLRIKPGIFERIETNLLKRIPELNEIYTALFINGGDKEYYQNLFFNVKKLCIEHGLAYRNAFGDSEMR